MLFTDTYTYDNDICTKYKTEKINDILSGKSLFSDVYVWCSWSSFIVIGENLNLSYYLNFEIVIQHMWMYAYVTEKNIDMLLLKNIKSYTSKDFLNLYQIIMEMSLIVKRYNSVVTSTSHDRENELMIRLKETSKLVMIENNIDTKIAVLKNRMDWSINVKRLKSDHNMEMFVLFLTIIQVLTAFNFQIQDILDVKILSLVFFILLICFFYRKHI